jgi:lipopolysaccharide/colanic/teichoic acid biosynthesis glycosyltransferase
VATGAVLVHMLDPVTHVLVAFVVGEGFALGALVLGALLRDPEEGEISHGYAVAKRSLDIAVALMAILLLSPVLLLSAVAVKLDSRGPAFFRQLRTGRNGVDFWIVKLRTMSLDHDDVVFHEHLSRLQESEDEAEHTIAIDEDPRVTSVGRLLRRWSLDELPNLWNVLKGSMSLVGPRPLVPEEADLVGLDNPRFLVKPGITGHAQVHGRDSISMPERTALDEEYVRIRSMTVDIKTLLATFATVFRTKGEDTKF